MQLKKGVKLLEEIVGEGEEVKRQENYLTSMRITLNKGEIVEGCLSHYVDEYTQTDDDGFFQHRVRIDRENLIPGIFYAVQGMKVGGYRKVEISYHLAYGEKGISGKIPPKAKIIAEIKILEKI